MVGRLIDGFFLEHVVRHVCSSIRARRCKSKTHHLATVDTLTLCRLLRNKTSRGRRGHAVGSFQYARFFLFTPVDSYLSTLLFSRAKSALSTILRLYAAKDLKKKISRDCLVIYGVNSSSKTAKSTAAISLGQDGRIHCVIRNTLRIARNPPPCQSVAPKWRTRPRRLTSKTRCLQTARSWVRQATRPTPVRASQSLSRGRDACCPCPPRRTVSHARTYHVRGCKAC